MLARPRRDTLDAFNKVNPILNYNELVKVFMPNGTNKWKIGDGESRFSELPYIANNILILNLNQNYNVGCLEIDFTNEEKTTKYEIINE